VTRRLAVPTVLVVALLAGCGGSDSAGDSTGGGIAGASPDTGGRGAKVAYISPVAAQPGQQEIGLGLRAGARELGWEDSVLDSNLSADRQVANIDTAISQRRDAIASWTLDPGAAAGAYTRAVAAGIPVIGMNSAGEGVTSTVWWEYITCRPGGPADRTARFIARQAPGTRTIVMGGPPAPSIIAQVRCFTAAARKAGLNVVNHTDNTSDTADGAQRLMGDLLTKHPDVQAVWSYNDQSALGDSAAIAEAGRRVAGAGGDGIVVIGHNGDADAIKAVRDGRLTGTWDPDNVASGMAAIRQMQTALKGGADRTYPAITVRSTLYTGANIADYAPASRRSYTLASLPLVGDGG
jgi:ribose transport system substrate-binding protein